MKSEREKILEDLLVKIEKYGDFNAYYYINRGEIRTDVFLSKEGSYVNGDDVAIRPLRSMATRLIEIISQKMDSSKQDQLRIF